MTAKCSDRTFCELILGRFFDEETRCAGSLSILLSFDSKELDDNFDSTIEKG